MGASSPLHFIIEVVWRRHAPPDVLLLAPLRLGFLENVYEKPHKPTIYVILTSCFNLPLLFSTLYFYNQSSIGGQSTSVNSVVRLPTDFS